MTGVLDAWAARWGIPLAALVDLRASFTDGTLRPTGVSETAVQQAIRIDACKNGARLWRNNVGACATEDGRQIRYGLANDSPRINRAIKSSDLIGITPMVIAGQTVGVFTSVEVKRPGWKYRGTTREQAQRAWLELVVSFGGIARFSTGPE